MHPNHLQTPDMTTLKLRKVMAEKRPSEPSSFLIVWGWVIFLYMFWILFFIFLLTFLSVCDHDILPLRFFQGNF